MDDSEDDKEEEAGPAKKRRTEDADTDVAESHTEAGDSGAVAQD